MKKRPWIASEGNGFDVYVSLSSDLIHNIEHLKSLINARLSWHGACVHVCMFMLNDNIVKFQTSCLIGWSEETAHIVLEKVVESIPIYERDTLLVKRRRQVRDALNKCNDPAIIEEIGCLLKI